MITTDHVLAVITATLPNARVELLLNPSPSAQHSLLVAPSDLVAVASALRENAELALDYCSNATGIDWPGKEVTEKVKVSKIVDGAEQLVEETIKRVEP